MLRKLVFVLALASLVLAACSAGAPPSPAIDPTALTQAPTATSNQTATPTESVPSPTPIPPTPTFVVSSNVVDMYVAVPILGDKNEKLITTWEATMSEKDVSNTGARVVAFRVEKHKKFFVFVLPDKVWKFYIRPAGSKAGSYPTLYFCTTDSQSCIWEKAEKAVALEDAMVTETQRELLVNMINLAKDHNACLPRHELIGQFTPCVRAYPTATSTPTP